MEAGTKGSRPKARFLLVYMFIYLVTLSYGACTIGGRRAIVEQHSQKDFELTYSRKM
jgi:hypothetical protein